MKKLDRDDVFDGMIGIVLGILLIGICCGAAAGLFVAFFKAVWDYGFHEAAAFMPWDSDALGRAYARTVLMTVLYLILPGALVGWANRDRW